MPEQQKLTIDEALNLTEAWLVTGKFNPNILANAFQFNSPFWQSANKIEFLARFGDPTEYQKVSLAQITHFDPIIQLKNPDGKHFAIILQYHTKNGGHVYETVIGSLVEGLISELRSIYDLEETKKALSID